MPKKDKERSAMEIWGIGSALFRQQALGPPSFGVHGPFIDDPREFMFAVALSKERAEMLCVAMNAGDFSSLDTTGAEEVMQERADWRVVAIPVQPGHAAAMRADTAIIIVFEDTEHQQHYGHQCSARAPTQQEHAYRCFFEMLCPEHLVNGNEAACEQR